LVIVVALAGISFSAVSEKMRSFVQFVFFTIILVGFSLMPEPVEAEPAALLDVPNVRQHTAYACGAAALQAILAYYDHDVRQDTLMAKLGTNKVDGTTYWNIIRVAQEYGLKPTVIAHMTRNRMIAEINRGIPVLIAIQAWIDDGNPRDLAGWAARTDDGHYLVAIGYDRNRMYFEDPAMFGVGYIEFDELEARWHDYDQKGNRLDHFAIIFERDKATVAKKPRFSPIN
jgi:predicted double-glycine peptidase